MELTGRITADASVNKLNDGREVTNFTLVQNDQFTTKSGEKKKVATFFKCAYWVSSKAANHLKKGAIVTVYGRIGLDVYINMKGEADGSLTLHVNNIKFVSAPSGVVTAAIAPQQPIPGDNVDDLPF